MLSVISVVKSNKCCPIIFNLAPLREAYFKLVRFCVRFTDYFQTLRAAVKQQIHN
jgi:hypothetical protein